MADETPEKELASAIGALKFALQNVPAAPPISLSDIFDVRKALEACLDGFQAVEKLVEKRRS